MRGCWPPGGTSTPRRSCAQATPCSSEAQPITTWSRTSGAVIYAVKSGVSRSRAGGERLDLHAVADEGRHDHDAAGEENAGEDVFAVEPDAEQVGERPAAGEGRAEHFRADQNRGGNDRRDIVPDDTAGFGGVG